MDADADFRKRVMLTFRTYKYHFGEEANELTIPVLQGETCVARLRPVPSNVEEVTTYDIELITQWRNEHPGSFLTWFKATEDGTKKWLQERVIEVDDRILFMIQTTDNAPFGHIGLSNFDYLNRACEIDYLVRGIEGIVPGGMTSALQALLAWSRSELHLRSLFLRVFSDNRKAISLYSRCGLKKSREVPLRRIDRGGTGEWVELEAASAGDRYLTYMTTDDLGALR